MAQKAPPPHRDGAELTTVSPSLPAVGRGAAGPRSKIPSASPSRINRPSPGRSRIPGMSPGPEDGGGGSLGRNVSPGGGWSMFNRNEIKPKAEVGMGRVRVQGEGEEGGGKAGGGGNVPREKQGAKKG